jgi:hypothetical protein
VCGTKKDTNKQRNKQMDRSPEVGDADGSDASICSRPTGHRDDIGNLAEINTAQFGSDAENRD